MLSDGDGFPDNNDLNPTGYDVAVEQVVGTGDVGTVIRLNTGAIWRLSGLKNLNEYYEQYYTRIFNISPGGKEYLESVKRTLDANRESNFTIKELAILQRIDLPGVVDYMDGRNFTFKKQLLSEVRGEQCTDEAARSAYSIVSAASAWTDYFRVTWNQIVRGKFAEETNLLGTIGEIGMAFVGFDFFQDFRDFTHGAIFWDEGDLQDKVETVINGTVSLVPVVGVLAKGDELLALIKHGDDVMELRNIEKLREIKNLEGVCYIDEFGLMSGSAGSALLGIDPSTYRMVLGVSDEYGFYRYSYNNPIVDAFADCEEIVNDLNKTSPGTLEEIAEEAAKQTGKSADEVEEFVEEALEDARKKVDAGGGLKSGKDLIKNISKIEYGTDELSKVAIEFRKANNITSARRNVCVVEYKNADGTIVQKAFASNASNHSEELMIDFLKADNISGEDVIKIFTEREPCVETATNVGHNCTNRIIEYTPDAEVTYAVDYGVTQEDGLNARNILQELLQNLLN